MSDPPKLNYWSPSAKRRSPKEYRFIGLLGCLAYCIPAFIFDVLVVAGIVGLVRWPSLKDSMGLTICAAVGAFCTWRAIAGIMQFFG
jgi:hypothetical protein